MYNVSVKHIVGKKIERSVKDMNKKMNKVKSAVLSGMIAVGSVAGSFAAVAPSLNASAASTDNYAKLLQYSLYFYDANMCGKNVGERSALTWRDDCHTSDAVDGGYHDAGDHVKFNLPMAYTATMLAWSVYEYPQAYDESGQLAYALGDIRWITDYLIRCHPEDNVYYYQVGDGSADHSWWGPCEVMTMNRPSYFVDSSNPGSAVSGEAAAALAAASIVFTPYDAEYSALCLEHAQSLYEFADTTRSDAGYTAANGFYDSL